MDKTMQWMYAHLPVMVCALAAVLAPSLQLVKAKVPQLQGWKALAANFAMSVVGVFAVTPPGQFWTVTAWAHVLMLCLGAAGIHGTATKLLAPTTQSWA